MSIKKAFANVQRINLSNSAKDAIIHSYDITAKLAKANYRTQEEDFVATLVTHGVNKLNSSWGPLLKAVGIDFKMTGVFIHGHPRVQFYSNARNTTSVIELGDILIIHKCESKGKQYNRAFLIQAKMGPQGKHTLHPLDEQLDLYTNWYAFNFYSLMADKTKQYDISAQKNGTAYALIKMPSDKLISPSWPNQCPWAISNTTKYLTSTTSLYITLTDILTFKSGRAFNPNRSNPNTKKRDWDELISDILNDLRGKTFNRSKIGITGHERVAQFMTSYPSLDFRTSNMPTFLKKLPYGPFSERVDEDKLIEIRSTIDSVIGYPPSPPTKDRTEGPMGDGGISLIVMESKIY